MAAAAEGNGRNWFPVRSEPGEQKVSGSKRVGKNGVPALITLRIPIASSLGSRSGLQGLGFLFNGFLLMHRSETSGKCQYLLVSTDSSVRPCQQPFTILLNNINYEQYCNVLPSINL